MSPRDISYNLNKKEGDIVRRLKKMEKYGLVKSAWGSRLGQSVKLYYLMTQNIGIGIGQDAIEIKFTKNDKVEKSYLAERKAKKAEKLVIRPVGSTEFFEPLEKGQLLKIVGRNEELDFFKNKAINFFFIVGIAGVGKTTLVKKFLGESASKATNKTKVFWHAFREIDTLAFLLGKIAGFLSTYKIQNLSIYLDNRTNSLSTDNNRVGSSSLYDSSSLDVTINALNRLSSCVLVFDDYQKVKDENIPVFMRHLQQNYKNRLILISRSKPPFFIDSVKSKEIVLSGLQFDDAMRMIKDFQTTLNESVLRSIWKKTEGHPMALKILSSLITTRRKEVSEPKGEEEKDLAYSQIASIDKLRSYLQREILETLSEDELDILLTLCIFRNPVKAWALKRKGSSKVGRRRSLDYLLHLLERKMLIDTTSTNEYYLHDMLKDILYTMLAYPEEMHSFASHYYLSSNTANSIVEALYHLTKSHDIDRVFEILEEEVISERYRFIEEGYAASLVDILAELNISNTNKSKLVYLYAIQGKALSMLEKWDEANEKLDGAIKMARYYSSPAYEGKNSNSNNNNNLLLAYSLRTLSESFYLQGDFLTVEKNLLQAAHIFQTHQNMEKNLHDVYMKLARLYFATGRNEESKSYSDLAQSLIEAN